MLLSSVSLQARSCNTDLANPTRTADIRLSTHVRSTDARSSADWPCSELAAYYIGHGRFKQTRLVGGSVGQQFDTTLLIHSPCSAHRDLQPALRLPYSVPTERMDVRGMPTLATMYGLRVPSGGPSPSASLQAPSTYGVRSTGGSTGEMVRVMTLSLPHSPQPSPLPSQCPASCTM